MDVTLTCNKCGQEVKVATPIEAVSMLINAAEKCGSCSMGGGGTQGPAGPAGPQGEQGPAGAGFEFPIGYVYISVDVTNPGELFGYGTWEAFASGKVLVGLDANDTDFDTAGEIGGSKSATPSAHSGAAVGNHSSVSVPVTGTTAVKIGTSGSSAAAQTHTHTIPTITHVVTQPGNHAAMSTVQPYVVVYMFKRVA